MILLPPAREKEMQPPAREKEMQLPAREKGCLFRPDYLVAPFCAGIGYLFLRWKVSFIAQRSLPCPTLCRIQLNIAQSRMSFKILIFETQNIYNPDNYEQKIHP